MGYPEVASFPGGAIPVLSAFPHGPGVHSGARRQQGPTDMYNLSAAPHPRPLEPGATRALAGPRRRWTRASGSSSAACAGTGEAGGKPGPLLGARAPAALTGRPAAAPAASASRGARAAPARAAPEPPPWAPGSAPRAAILPEATARRQGPTCSESEGQPGWRSPPRVRGRGPLTPRWGLAFILRELQQRPGKLRFVPCAAHATRAEQRRRLWV